MASIVNSDNGRVIAASQRPDGTWRKERRVKDGYTPQDEVPLYESRGKQWASKPIYSHGLDPQSVKVAEVKKKKKKGSGGVQAQPVQKIPLAEFRSTAEPTIAYPEEKWETVDAKGRGKSNKKEPPKQLQQQAAPIKKIQPEPVVPHEPAKRLRNLKKKLKEIEQLEARINSKELKNPDKDQLSKVTRKEEIEDAILALELEISSLNTA